MFGSKKNCRFKPEELSFSFRITDKPCLLVDNFFVADRFLLSCISQLPWKSLTSIIEYYYMWKTTDRYVQQVKKTTQTLITHRLPQKLK